MNNSVQISKDLCFNHIDSNPIPLLESVVGIIQQARNIIFPGYFSQYTLASSNIEYCLRQETSELIKNVSKLIILSFLFYQITKVYDDGTLLRTAILSNFETNWTNFHGAHLKEADLRRIK